MATLGERFARALADRDHEALGALLADRIDFRGLTPGRSWAAETRAEVHEILLGNWFEETDRIEELAHLESGDPVGDTSRVGYRFHLVNADGPQVVEQQAYYRAVDGRVDYLRVVCSGFRART